MHNTPQHEALTSVMADAGALPCSRCGRQTAVRVESTEGVNENLVSSHTQDMIWCFECGHEEPITH